MKSRPLKLIEWVDSTTTARWQDTRDIRTTPSRCATVGFLVHSTKDAITLAQSLDRDGGDVNATMTIPRGCIKSIRNVK